ncbi:MAG: hypothetical protein JEZ00_19700 [Anaerolineaceae bacterium]|nr:hypothetical protein [Anaerolineaceae bacterium]
MKNPRRQYWKQQQKEMRGNLTRIVDLPATIDLFLLQHGMQHVAELTPNLSIHFQDEDYLAKEKILCYVYKQQEMLIE